MPNDPMIQLPGAGPRIAVSQLVDQSYYGGRHTTIASDPKEYIIDPNPTSTYAWIQYTNKKGGEGNPRLKGMIRSQIARVVEETEIKDDTDLDYHLNRDDMVCWRDVALVEVKKEHATRLWGHKEQRTYQSLIDPTSMAAALQQGGRGEVTAESSFEVVPK